MTRATINRRTFLATAGRIELQAHDAGRWIEYKQIKIRRL